ncbi:MAG: UDP-3-O-acyl-N-acetylglucosamine deacetylase [Synergistaceae bacterium]|jgi:UDP-3-O-[3-hydroxymyristoyl] N-acetylglucosamine deacetylase|nr:UDP-3-O-acyl-N-acetylglucosamine deacetylase [Synergistaceae bacterium]
MNYRKLTRSIARRGKGLHSGRDYGLSIEPSDGALSLEVQGECLPLAQLALEGTGRGSDLIFPDGKRVRTCEHVLSALVGSGVWQAKLVVTGGDKEFEMPGLDGCAANLAEEIAEKSVSLGVNPPGPGPLKLQVPIHVGDSSRFVTALPSAYFHVTYVIDYDAAPIGTQIFDYRDRAQGETGRSSDYLREIAPARTFAMRSDVDALRAAGLALGGSLDNAVLVDETGVETAGGLRFPDEFVRHKTLDLLGDLANLGRPLVAHVVAVRGGHVQHLQLVERLRAVSRTV